ncbi:hypothetical protein B0H10DRAFT_2438732 [Mycena sp. CBHHK59/15]|nr:hypothetical protein B0H10DRAFT_2438732 [Mycena sp. CBHHK59/15]
MVEEQRTREDKTLSEGDITLATATTFHDARIYTSNTPDVSLVSTSIFTRLFAPRASGDVGGYPGSTKVFTNGTSGASIAHIQLLHLCLCFGYGLRDHPTTRPHAKRGATALIYSPNSLAWPVALHGSVAAGLRVTFANSAYTSRGLAHQFSTATPNCCSAPKKASARCAPCSLSWEFRRTRGTSRRSFWGAIFNEPGALTLGVARMPTGS